MFDLIKQLLRKISGVFAVTDNRYSIKQIPETADEAGMGYCLTEKATGQSWNIYVRRKGSVYDLDAPSIIPLVDKKDSADALSWTGNQ